MSDPALLHYATPPRRADLRLNGLAVFALVWTVAVAPTAALLFFHVSAWAASVVSRAAFQGISVVALVLTPAVAVLSGYVATERGAGWDSPYRWTALAVVAVPLASVITSAGAMYWVRELL